VANLGHGGSTATIGLALDDKAAANSGANGDVEDGLRADTCAVLGFGQGGHIAVVANDGRDLKRSFAPTGEWERFPTVNLVALGRAASDGVARTAKANAEPLNGKLLRQRETHRFDLIENARRAARGINVAAFDSHKFGTGPIADTKLQLRAADFDAEKHENEMPNVGMTNDQIIQVHLETRHLAIRIFGHSDFVIRHFSA
jgi:hypothetical protein